MSGNEHDSHRRLAQRAHQPGLLDMASLRDTHARLTRPGLGLASSDLAQQIAARGSDMASLPLASGQLVLAQPGQNDFSSRPVSLTAAAGDAASGPSQAAALAVSPGAPVEGRPTTDALLGQTPNSPTQIDAATAPDPQHQIAVSSRGGSAAAAPAPTSAAATSASVAATSITSIADETHALSLASPLPLAIGRPAQSMDAPTASTLGIAAAVQAHSAAGPSASFAPAQASPPPAVAAGVVAGAVAAPTTPLSPTPAGPTLDVGREAVRAVERRLRIERERQGLPRWKR